ncbi:MAG: RsmE family RNA methyltransferase [Treponema sp.]
MNIILIHAEELKSGNFILRRQDERFRHIKKVLKCSTGDIFKAGIINGKKGTAKITLYSEEYLEAAFFPEQDSMPLPPVRLILGFPRPIQLRRILRDIAGLGVEKLYLIGTDLGEKSYMAADIAHVSEITRLLTDGCCQAGETLIPAVAIFRNVDHFFAEYADRGVYTGIKALLDVPQRFCQAGHTAGSVHDKEAHIITAVHSPCCYPLSVLKPVANQSVMLAIGSERGWSDRERCLFAAQGFTVYTMGTRILRTETATAAALAVCLANAGWWK